MKEIATIVRGSNRGKWEINRGVFAQDMIVKVELIHDIPSRAHEGYYR